MTVFLHGFGGSPDDWKPLRARLDATTAITPTLPGHHTTVIEPDWSLNNPGDWLTHIGVPEGRHVWVGYSLGARVAMSVLRTHPERVSGLVLISGHPGLRNEGDRAERLRQDERTAELLRTEVPDAFWKKWIEQPVFEHDRADFLKDWASYLAARERHDREGLASALVQFSTGLMPPCTEGLRTCSVPVLALTGGKDTKYSQLWRDVSTSMPHVQHRQIADAGHNPVLSSPDLVTEAIDAQVLLARAGSRELVRSRPSPG